MAASNDPTARERIVATAVAFMSGRGYAAASLRDIVDAAGASRGSLQHYFPGGKDQLVVEALQLGTDLVGASIDDAFGRGTTLDGALGVFFERAAGRLGEHHFARGCPVGTVALELAGGEEDAVSRACVAAFDDWTARFERGFLAAGLAPPEARRLAGLTIAQYEGALMIARATRSTQPLEQASALIRALAGESLATAGAPTEGA